MDDSTVEKLGEEIYRAYAARATEVDNSATTVGKAYARLTGGKGCQIPIIRDTGCSKSIISEEAVRSLGSQITELDRSLKIISASGEALTIIGVADIYI